MSAVVISRMKQLVLIVSNNAKIFCAQNIQGANLRYYHFSFSQRQGEFVPENNLSGSITADPNTQEMIAASVDPAPRITDVPFKTTVVKKTTKINLRRQEQSTSQIL